MSSARSATSSVSAPISAAKTCTSPVWGPAEVARKLLLVYLERINELADRPEFYHLLSNSCTINIVRYANLVGRSGDFDFRHYLNGWVDRYFYDTRLLTTEFPFAELRQRSRVDASVKASEEIEDFSQHIRESVPGMRP